MIFHAGPIFQCKVIASANSKTHPLIDMAHTQTKGLPKTVCSVCWKTYVHNGHFLRHIKAKHPGELSEILENQSKEAGEGPNQVRLNNCMEVDGMDGIDIDVMNVRLGREPELRG